MCDFIVIRENREKRAALIQEQNGRLTFAIKRKKLQLFCHPTRLDLAIKLFDYFTK